MDDDLRDHRPSEETRRRAEANGIDLERLREEDPDSYRMLCSVPLLSASAQLRPLLDAPLAGALPDQRLFELPQGGRVEVRAFPGPDSEGLERMDAGMGEVVEEHLDSYVYYRVVRDLAGTHREFSLPTAPEEWQGEETMVGPFANEAEAGSWAGPHVDGSQGFTYDVVPYAGGWFCDIFRADGL